MPAKGGSSGRLGGGSGSGIPGGRGRGGRPSPAQKKQNTAAKTYITKDPTRVEAAKKAAATRKANAAQALRDASRTGKAKGRRQGLKAGIGAGAATGAAVSFATTKGSEGPKKSVPVAKKSTTKRRGR